MKINCTIDGNQYNLTVNADKPLYSILTELFPSFQIQNGCRKASCGNCMVLINGSAVLSCLVPAFRVPGTAILTYSGFRKTRFCHDIERAYAETGITPCSQCYASKTLLIGSLLNRMDQSKPGIQEIKYTASVSPEYLEKELSLINCRCTEISKLENVIRLAYTYRRRRSGR